MTVRAGDKIRVLSKSGFYHHGIFIGWWRGCPDCVVHNAKFKQVEVTSLEAFTDGRQVEVIARPRTPQDADQIISRALSLLGERYDLVSFNCEHFVNYATTGWATSQTVAALAAVGVVIGLAFLARSGA